MKKSISLLCLVILVSTSSFSNSPKYFPKEKELISYFDSICQSELEKQDVPGAVVTIVKNGEIVFNRGYGFADIEAKRTVDPVRTVFRVASITKTFTAMAILQQVEKGTLDLHADLRPIIEEDFGVQYPYPLTLHHIMTHTTGFDYSSIGSHQGNSSDLLQVDMAKIKLPPMVLKPGTTFWYSNVAFGLLGHILERTTSQTYADYMQENILDKLGMLHSTFATRLPDRIKAHRALSYKRVNGVQTRDERQFLGNPAASSLETTGGDMGIYLQALLNPAILDSLGVLNIQSFDLMTSPQYNPGQSLQSIGYAFFIGNTQNHSSLAHGGGVRGFLSVMEVIPDAGLGVFVAQNNRYGSEAFGWGLKWAIQDTILDWLPADLSYVEPEEISLDIKHFAGRYFQQTYNRSTFEKSEKIINGQQREKIVKVISNNKIALEENEYVRISNTVFKSTRDNSEYTIGFTLGKKGNVEDLVINRGVLIQLRKIPFYKSTLLNQIILGTCLLFLLFLMILGIRKRHYDPDITSYQKFFEKWKTYNSAILVIGFLSMFGAYFIVDTIKHGVPLTYKIPMIIMTIGAIGVVLSPFALISELISDKPLRSRILGILGVIGIAVFTWYLYDMNLVGMKW